MTDVNVLRAAGNVQSDHHLVVCKVKVKRGWAPPPPRDEVQEVVKVGKAIEECCMQGRV